MKKWVVLVLLAAAMFIIVIDTTIMNVSISDLVEDLGTTVGGIQAAISLYALVMASFMLVGGKLGGLIGPRRTFVIGLCIFGVGTTVASFSENLATLIIGWSVVEGIGSALMMPNIQTILRRRYEGPDRALGYGLISAVAAIGAAVGPIVGGYLTTYHSWRWAFRLEVVIVVVVLAFSGQIARDVLAERRPRFDLPGAVLSGVGFATIVLGILLIQDYGAWQAKQPLSIGSLEIAPFGLSVVPFLVGFGVLLLAIVLNYERSREEKGEPGLFRPSLLKTPSLLATLTARLLQMAVMAGVLFTIPLLFQLSFEFTAMQTGVALIPFSLGVLVLAVIGARLSSRFQAKRLIQIGFIVGVAGLGALMATVKPDVSSSDIASGAALGAGMGLVASQILNLIFSLVSDEDTAETAGVNGTFEQLGNSLGVALVGTVMVATLTAGLQTGIEQSDVIPDADKSLLVQETQQGVELVSDAQIEEALATTDADEGVRDELLEIYRNERTDSFRAALAFLVFLSLLALIISPRLKGGRLVDSESASDEQKQDTAPEQAL